MSFYFTLQTAAHFDPDAVLGVLKAQDVQYIQQDQDVITFFQPGKSVRGVCVYPTDQDIQIGLNAFTPRADAELTSQVTEAAARLLGCDILPEGNSDVVSPDQVSAFCDEAWINARVNEARSLLVHQKSSGKDEELIVQGYRRPFATTNALINTHKGTDGTFEDALHMVFADAMILQEIDQSEDIFAANVLQAQPPAPKVGFLGRLFGKSSDAKAGFAAFVLTRDVRTLTPVNNTSLPFFAILAASNGQHIKVPVAEFYAAARATGAREYCIGSFDIDLPNDAYDALCAKGEPM